MFCPYCGAQLPERTAYCPVCGNALAAASQPVNDDSTQLLDDSTQILPEEPVYPVPPQPYGQPVPPRQPPVPQAYPPQYAQPGYPVQQPKPRKSLKLLPILIAAGGSVVLILVLILVLSLAGGSKMPSLKYQGQTYSYGDSTLLEPGLQDLGNGTSVLVREDRDTGERSIVMVVAREGSTASVGGLQVGDSFLKVSNKFKGITAEQYNYIDGTTVKMDPWDRAEYTLYYVDGKTYDVREYQEALPNMAEDPEAHYAFRENTCMISVSVRNGLVTAIYFGDQRALTTLH